MRTITDIDKGHILRMALLIITAAALMLTSGCATVHRYPEYHGQVVEKGTGKPIEGAAVLFVYYTAAKTFAGDVSKYIGSHETLTDKDGYYRIPVDWMGTFRVFHAWEKAPMVYIFKPGYTCHKYGFKEKVELEDVTGWDRERRRKSIRCFPGYGVPDEKQKNLRDLINKAYAEIGLKEE